MGTNTLDSLTPPHDIVADDFNQYFTALTGNLVPRNASSGAPETAVHSLGTAVLEWKNIYTENIFLDGQLFDPDAIGVDSDFAIVSGAVRSGSQMPDFLRASGSGATMTILATATPLNITANGTSVSIVADIAVSSLTVAPAANNTCLVNDAALVDQDASKYTGEMYGDPITIDTVGTEISNRVGQYICLKASTEYMLAFVESATSLRRCFRGYFFNSSGAPVVRETLANNDTLTIMSLGWVFMDTNGTTVDVSYRSPYYSAVAPASPVTDDYWFDLTLRLWKRYDGAAFQTVSRTLIGLVVIDGTNCVATRSADFTKSYSDFIDCEVALVGNTSVQTQKGYSILSVYGQAQELFAGSFLWDITAHLESGLTEAVSTFYYLYVTEKGAPKIAVERPYNRLHDLRGFYHPYHSWRYVGVAYNNSSSNLSSVNSHNNNNPRMDVFTASGEWLALPDQSVKITVIGGGAASGESGGTGNSGGTSSFGSLLSATGGSGGGVGSTNSANGGSSGIGSGGDLNFTGSPAGAGFIADHGVNEPVLCGHGGSTLFGGGGRGFSSLITTAQGGQNGQGYGAGGSGEADGATNPYGGGGPGGTAIKTTALLFGRYAITIGAAGALANDGGAGTAGLVLVEYQT